MRVSELNFNNVIQISIVIASFLLDADWLEIGKQVFAMVGIFLFRSRI